LALSFGLLYGMCGNEFAVTEHELAFDDRMNVVG
jgi:hypothetical protein